MSRSTEKVDYNVGMWEGHQILALAHTYQNKPQRRQNPCPPCSGKITTIKTNLSGSVGFQGSQLLPVEFLEEGYTLQGCVFEGL